MVRSESTPLSVDRKLEREGILTEVTLLVKVVEISQGRGNLIILVVNEPYIRDLIVNVINEKFKTKEVVVTKREQISRKSIDEKSDVYFWQLPESVSPDILNALNFRRELFYETDFPHVVICNEGVLNALIRDAPDFWRYKGSFYIVKGKPVQTIPDLLLFGCERWEKNVPREIEINEYLLEKVKSDGQRAYLLFERAQLYLRLYECEKALEYYRKSLEIFENLGNLYESAMAYRQIGVTYQIQGEYEKARKYYRKSLEIFENLEDVQGVAKTYHNMGSIYQVQEQYSKAREYYNKSLEIFENLQDTHSIAKTYHNMGIIHQAQGEYNEAREYYNKSLEIFENLQDVQGVAKTYHNIGIVNQIQGEYNEAREYYNKSLKIKEKIHDMKGIAATYHNMGIIHQAQGEYEKALEYYNKSLEIKEKIHDMKGIAVTGRQIRMVHEDREEYGR